MIIKTRYEFAEKMQEYYGAYSEKVVDHVLDYLERDVDDEALDRLYRETLYNHPRNFGPPDVAALEKARNAGNIGRKIKTNACQNEFVPEEERVTPADFKRLMDEVLSRIRKDKNELRREAI